MMARTGCGIDAADVFTSSDNSADDDEVEFDVEVAQNDVAVITSDFIVDSSCCCLRCSNFRRFSRSSNCNSVGLVSDSVEVVGLAVAISFSSVHTGKVALIILTVSVHLTRLMTSKAHLSNLQ